MSIQHRRRHSCQAQRRRVSRRFLSFWIMCEDPHNLGAIIRTANLAGAHGVIIPKRRAVGLTSTVAKTSAGAINYTPVAKVTNLVRTMEELKAKRHLVCLCGYGRRRACTTYESDGTDRSCDRKRGRRCQPSCKRGM